MSAEKYYVRQEFIREFLAAKACFDAALQDFIKSLIDKFCTTPETFNLLFPGDYNKLIRRGIQSLEEGRL